MTMQRTLKQLAEDLNLNFRGNPDLQLTGVGTLDSADEHMVSFLANPKYKDKLPTTRAGVVVLTPDVPYERACLLSANPYADFTKIVYRFAPPIPLPKSGIHPLSQVDASASVGENVAIGPFCVVGARARIGKNTVLAAQVFLGDDTVLGDNCIVYPQVVLRERISVGNRVIIHPGTVLGSDGFGFAPVGETYVKIPQIGTIVVEDDVEIGANVTIDRATLGETRLGQGCKLDNLVQIAHNVVIGPHSVVAAQTGISGSSTVGKHAMIGGQVGVSGHLTIGNNVILGAQAGVTRNVPDKEFVSGYPARPHNEAMRQLAAVSRLPELIKKIQRLEARLTALEGK